jgi:hypothetical protein
MGLDHTPLLLDSQSALWPFLAEHFGQKLYQCTEDANLYSEAVVIDQQQGKELIGGKICYLVKTPQKKEIAIVLSQKSVIKAMVTSIADVIHIEDVQKRLDLLDSKKGMVHMKQEQKPLKYRAQCRANMARIHALKDLGVNLMLRPLEDSPLVTPQDSAAFQESVQFYTTELKSQLDQLGATVSDLMVPGMRINFMTVDAPTPWLICNLVLGATSLLIAEVQQKQSKLDKQSKTSKKRKKM